VGDKVKKDDIIGYIESMKTYNAVTSEVEGTVTEICYANGDSVEEEDILIKMQ
jgi:pyruvate carboxylase subunit B